MNMKLINLLKEGKIAVMVNNMRDAPKLNNVLAYAFYDSSPNMGASFKYYFKSKNGYDCSNNTDLPIYNINDFFKEESIEKEIVGYKLIKPEYRKAAEKIGNFVNFEVFERYTHIVPNSIGGFQKVAKKLAEAGVLDLWFEPVYETEKKVIVLSNSKSVIVNKDSAEVENTIIKITSIQNLLNQVLYLDDTSWRITSNSFDIGCWKNVLRSDLELIINTAKTL